MHTPNYRHWNEKYSTFLRITDLLVIPARENSNCQMSPARCFKRSYTTTTILSGMFPNRQVPVSDGSLASLEYTEQQCSPVCGFREGTRSWYISAVMHVDFYSMKQFCIYQNITISPYFTHRKWLRYDCACVYLPRIPSTILSISVLIVVASIMWVCCNWSAPLSEKSTCSVSYGSGLSEEQLPARGITQAHAVTSEKSR